jgi:hypothetical protein
MTKEQFLLENGWERHGKTHWVKTEWLHEPETLKREPHLCPNWYHSETLDSAYETAIVEIAVQKAVQKAKEEASTEVTQILERILLDAANGLWWSDVRSAVKGFSKEKLYRWYLSECKGTPNPFIVKTFGE